MSNDRMIYNGNLGSYEQKAAIQNANAVHYEKRQCRDAAIQNANAVYYGMLPKSEGVKLNEDDNGYGYFDNKEKARMMVDAAVKGIVGKSRRR